MVIYSHEVGSKMASERSSTARFENVVTKSGDLQSSAARNIGSKREIRVSLMDEIIVLLDGYFRSSQRNSDCNALKFSIASAAH